jgi:hypothetical protein
LAAAGFAEVFLAPDFAAALFAEVRADGFRLGLGLALAFAFAPLPACAPAAPPTTAPTAAPSGPSSDPAAAPAAAPPAAPNPDGISLDFVFFLVFAIPRPPEAEPSHEIV